MNQTLSLNGDWKLLHSDGERGRAEYALAETIQPERYLAAQVPGSVHLDLMRAGLIDDPALGLNSLKARWVEECIWAYRREFDFTAPAAPTAVWLVLECLDLNAKIYLNGQQVGQHNNAFVPCRLEVSRFLRTGKNWITVIIESGIIGAGDKLSTGVGSKDAYHFGQNLHKQHWLRKPAYQFGWDWTARLGNVGISGDVTLEWSEETALRLDTLVPLVQVHEDLQTATVTVRARVENSGSTLQKVQLQAAIPELDWTADTAFEVEPGCHILEVVRDITGFALWWPTGAGEAILYSLAAHVLVDEVRLDYAPKRIGFRHVRVNQDPHPDGGNYCIVEVNHRRIFLKGANSIPADMILARVEDSRYRALIDRAVEANFNFLRVWGGGVYESGRTVPSRVRNTRSMMRPST